MEDGDGNRDTYVLFSIIYIYIFLGKIFLV